MLSLALLPETFSICKLPPTAPIPTWAQRGLFFSITRTRDELSLICPTRDLPANVEAEGNWCACQVIGPLEFSQIGILAGLAITLANAGVSLCALSTYDTDYVLVKAENLSRAGVALRQAGYAVQWPTE